MRGWQHSHNLKQTTLDRLGGVLGELKAERASLLTPEHTLTAGEEAQLARVDKALTQVEEALATLR